MPTQFEGVLPPVYHLFGNIGRNRVMQIAQPSRISLLLLEMQISRSVPRLHLTRDDGQKVLVVDRAIAAPDSVSVLRVKRDSLPADESWPQSIISAGRWVSPMPTDPSSLSTEELDRRRSRARTSWSGRVHLAAEHLSNGSFKAGLRPPQLGSVYATLAHWIASNDVATIVLPTGTGKTETMLTLLVHNAPERLLVIVPTDALRDQTASKFANLGLLVELGVVESAVEFPVVGVLKKAPPGTEEMRRFVNACNVVVATTSIVAGLEQGLLDCLASSISHLFIDEAHHQPAPTWSQISALFVDKPIAQFTATPFRMDGKHLAGKVVFSYPLRRAQEDGYFQKIRFHSVAEALPSAGDVSIAKAATQQLALDLDNGFDHIIMARADTIKRATEMHGLYTAISPQYNPVLLHSQQTGTTRALSLQQIASRESRIICCVDMLGEGFDLPQLKIAALHDVHKTLAVTLQFIGRFSRTASHVGMATVIANIANPDVEKSLGALYAQDADWNYLIQILSEHATGRYIKRDEFARQFVGTVPARIAIQNLFPAISARVYQVPGSDWYPHLAAGGFEKSQLFGEPLINEPAKLMLAITRHVEPVPWGDVRDVENVTWHIHLAHWDSDRSLLYVTSSDKVERLELVHALVGNTARLIDGEQIFRVLHGINRLLLINLGLSHNVARRINFSMLTGEDIRGALTGAEQRNKTKANLFGIGYENGDRVMIGCSRKGRIWAYRNATELAEWIPWCHHVGSKLIDRTITTDDILRYVTLPQTVQERPQIVAVAIDWGLETLHRREDRVSLLMGDVDVPFFDAELVITNFSEEGPIRFLVAASGSSLEYEVQFENGRAHYRALGQEAMISTARQSMPLSDWLHEDPPLIRFADGSALRGTDFLPIDPAPPLAREELSSWKWGPVNIQMESQRRSKRQESIQSEVIRRMQDGQFGRSYDIIFDDDDRGEAADIVGIAVEGARLFVHLVHCKFSIGKTAASRIDDLYEVCGQAQKSVRWRSDTPNLLRHLRSREQSRLKKYGTSRFEKGDIGLLSTLLRLSAETDIAFAITIVQPGVSKASASDQQLELLAATKLYLKETYEIPLDIIVSD